MKYWYILQHGWTLKTSCYRERSQTQKTTYCMIPLHEIFRTDKSIETESWLVVARGKGRQDLLLMGMGFLFVMMKCFKIRQSGWLYNLVSILKSSEFVKDEFYDTGIISQFFKNLRYKFYLTLILRVK